MKTTANQLKRTDEPPPDGRYPAIWGGYCGRFVHDGHQWEAQTKIGIRTPRAPAVVTIENGEITVELADQERP